MASVVEELMKAMIAIAQAESFLRQSLDTEAIAAADQLQAIREELGSARAHRTGGKK